MYLPEWPLPDIDPLSVHRNYLRKKIEKGARLDCPCCTQAVKVYNRQINKGMVINLARLYVAGGMDEAIHLPSIVGPYRADEAKLAYWGLTEDEGSRRSDGGRAGFWYCLPKGERFLMGELTVMRYAHVFNGKCLGLSNYHYDYRHQDGGKSKLRYKTTPVDVHEAYGTTFDLRDIL